MITYKAYRNVLIIVALTCLSGCDNNETPKTFEAYKKQPIINIKKLDKENKKKLYQDTFKNKLANTEITFSQLSECLDDMLSKRSGFVIFNQIYLLCLKQINKK